MNATVLTEQKRWTAQAYFDWSHPDDDTIYEVIYGELIEMTSPIFFHQTIAGTLYALLFAFLQRNPIGIAGIGPIDVVLGKHVVVPDVLFIRQERMAMIDDKVYGAPDMVAEVLSPSTRRYDLTKKRDLYAEAGIGEYWLLDPKTKTVQLLVLDGDAYSMFGEYQGKDVITSQLIERFKVVTNDLF